MYTVDEEDYSPADFDGVKGLEYGQMEDGTYWVSQTSYASPKVSKAPFRKCTAVFPFRWKPTASI